MPIVERWGADTMRLIILFAGPFEDDIDWKLIAGDDPNKRPGVHAWLGRVFNAVDDAVGRDAPESEELRRATARAVQGVTEDLERFRFNTAISKLQVLTNEMRAALDAGGGAREAAGALALMLAPLAPFAAEELWREVLGNPESVHRQSWPTFDASLVVEDTVTLVIQVNGKVRDRVEVPAGLSEAELIEHARASEKVQAHLDGEERRVIVVPDKLVNIVV
jgi:leucyl-tRNA synthetase